MGLPYGILVPQGWSNLWVAGLCASSDVQAHGSLRVQPVCAMMGQAAGTAAAQSVRTGQRAYLPQVLDGGVAVMTREA